MTTDFRALCAKVLAYNEGQGSYNFSHLNDYDRDNAAFDAWQEIKAELKSALAKPEPERPTVMQIIELADEIEAVGLGQVDLVRAALARWGHLALRPVSVSKRLPGPTDEALLELFNQNNWNYISPETFLDIAHSVLELQ
jgi:HEPN domain-containing protein